MNKELNKLKESLEELKAEAYKKTVRSALADDHRSLGYAEGVQSICSMVIDELKEIERK